MLELRKYLRKKSPSSVIVITDDNTAQHCLPLIADDLEPGWHHISLAPGEKSKSLENAAYIWSELLDKDADRNALVVNLGGGMVTDIGGFCAATYKRGVHFINIPTTLMGMVDAAHGGKTGVNTGPYKNQVGVFAGADMVLVHKDFLKTLPERELQSGYAEMLKYGLIQNASLWCSLATSKPENHEEWHEWIYTCIEIKDRIVKLDPKEKGLRKILNFGHTIGHSLESYSMAHDDEPLLHGEAVATGMICEAWLSHKKTGLPAASMDQVTHAIKSIYKPYPLQHSMYDELMDYMKKDKKNSNQKLKLALLNAIGKCDFDLECSLDDIAESLDYYQSVCHPSA